MEQEQEFQKNILMGIQLYQKIKLFLYLYVDNKPNGPLLIKGLKNKVNRIWVVGNGTKLSHKVVGKQYWSSVPGMLYIDASRKSSRQRCYCNCCTFKRKSRFV